MVLSKLTSSSPKLRSHLMSRLVGRLLSTAAKGEAKHEPNPELWRKIFIFVCIPAIALSAVNTYLIEKEHHEHYERPPFKKMEYMYIRTKPFPWGDGNHGLFHNPKYNALPEGYEDWPEDSHSKH